MDDTNMAMAKLICDLRKSKQYTQKQLAEKLNVTDKAVSKWERGIGYPDIKILPALAKVLDVSITELLKGEKAQTDEKADYETDTIARSAFAYAEKVSEIHLPRILRGSISALMCLFLVIALTFIFFTMNSASHLTYIKEMGVNYLAFHAASLNLLAQNGHWYFRVFFFMIAILCWSMILIGACGIFFTLLTTFHARFYLTAQKTADFFAVLSLWIAGAYILFGVAYAIAASLTLGSTYTGFMTNSFTLIFPMVGGFVTYKILPDVFADR